MYLFCFQLHTHARPFGDTAILIVEPLRCSIGVLESGELIIIENIDNDVVTAKKLNTERIFNIDYDDFSCCAQHLKVNDKS